MRNRGSHLVDTRLKHRVTRYLSDSSSQYVDIGVLAADLQRLYSSDYGRRKRNAFRIQVDKVYRLVRREMLDFEAEHLGKRARQSRMEDGGDLISDLSDSEDYPEYPPTNLMNSSLLNLYRKTNPEPAPTLPAKKVLEGASMHRQSAPGPASLPGGTPGVTGVSVGGWFIDSSPGARHSQGGGLDVCVDEKETGQSSERTEDSHMDRRERKRRRVNKRKQRGGEETRDVDRQIESSILNRKAGRKGFELQHSTVKFEDVGGCEETLKAVCQLLIHMRHPEVYQQLGVVPPRGFLLHGPPGCGKTLLAQAIVGELELPMLKVAATEIVTGVSGESEQKLRELFEEAVLQAPCIIFIDEIDAISPKREVASKDMERRIVAQLLACMDGESDYPGVCPG
ncbi:nuclear valosin-containing protein-like [Heterodontus francisci]|uniref:nuclear valosin-containing protein-like n=1 Tax=Heterodontus francisci TaxID=7792 RepID=UPI00355B9A8A